MSPWHFDALIDSTDPIPKRLDFNGISYFFIGVNTWHHFRTLQIVARAAEPIPKATFIDNEAEFRWNLLQDQVAFDKLHEGIKKFAEDGETLKHLLRTKLAA